MNNPAFEYLRQFKEVKSVTEELVLKTIKKKYHNITIDDLTNAFENGITGEYGKVYSADVQSLIGWVDEYMSRRSNKSHYLENGLLDPSVHITDARYPTGIREWNQEVNKCYNAYLRGVSPDNFHPHIYDRLVMDNKLHHSDFIKRMSSEAQAKYKSGNYSEVVNDIRNGKHKSISIYFEYRKSLGNDKIYEI